MLRLTISIFLVACLLALLIHVVLITSHVPSNDIRTIFLTTILGTALGIIVGTTLSITFGIALGISLSIAFSVAGSIDFSIDFSIAIGLAVGIVGDITFSNVNSITDDITDGIISSFISGAIFGIISGLISGFTIGVIAGIAGSISFITGRFRLPLFLLSGPSALITYLVIFCNKSHIFAYLHHSSLHWDERIYLPLPFLEKILLVAIEKDEEQAVEEIMFIINNQPSQIHAARTAALEVILRNLEKRKKIEEISEVWIYLNGILPQVAHPTSSQWIEVEKYFSEISIDAEKCRKPIGKQARQRALLNVTADLLKISNITSNDQKLNRRLKDITQTWQDTVSKEQERLMDGDSVYNPYKPAVPLGLHDESFVGRTDIVMRLSKELSNVGSSPTFLMNGERRMGKTTTLLQLPDLLGPSYIPVFYSVQDPAIYRDTLEFLGTLGKKIYEQIHNIRGNQVEPISPEILRDKYGLLQDAYAYNVFDGWLKDIEVLLEQEKVTLLLNFDEFERLAEAKQFDLRLLLDWFRNIIQFRPRIALLFSGLHTFTEMDQDTGVNWSGSFVNVQVLKVEFLKRNEAVQLITKPSSNYPSEELFGAGVVEKIVQVTGCHPFLIQAICYTLISSLQTEQRQRAEIYDVEVAIGRVLDGWDGYFGDLWIRTSEEQRVCLKALLTLKSADIALLQQQSGLDEHVLRRTLKALLRRDLIAQQSEMYTIVAPIFVEWVARNM